MTLLSFSACSVWSPKYQRTSFSQHVSASQHALLGARNIKDHAFYNTCEPLSMVCLETEV